MAEATDEPLLQVLRSVQADVPVIETSISAIGSDLSDVNQKVDGPTIKFAMPAGRVHHVEERVEALEGYRP